MARTFDVAGLEVQIGDTLEIVRPGPLDSMDVALCPAASLEEASPDAKIEYLPIGTTFRIFNARMRGATPWFRVAVNGNDDRTGWINSVALLPSRCEKAERSPA